MPTWYTIPLVSPPQTFSITLGNVVYQLTVQYRNTLSGVSAPGGWVLDIANQSGTALIQGIPLVTGCNLLAQYQYLNFGGELWVTTTNDPDAVPTYTNLGQQSNLYWVTLP